MADDLILMSLIGMAAYLGLTILVVLANFWRVSDRCLFFRAARALTYPVFLLGVVLLGLFFTLLVTQPSSQDKG